MNCHQCGVKFLNKYNFCPKCGAEIPLQGKDAENKEDNFATKELYQLEIPKKAKKPSKVWYLAPFLLLIIGGIIMYFACRNYNRKMAKGGLIIGFAWTVVVVSFWLAVAATMGTQSTAIEEISPEQIKAMAESPIYESLIRNIEYYEGKIVHYTGKIISVHDTGTNRYDLQVEVHCKPWPATWDCDYLWVDYTGERLLENDRVEFWGRIIGLTQVKYAFTNAETTIPEVKALILDCLNC